MCLLWAVLCELSVPSIFVIVLLFTAVDRVMPLVTVCYHQCKLFRMFNLVNHLAAALPPSIYVSDRSINLWYEHVHSTMKAYDEHLCCEPAF